MPTITEGMGKVDQAINMINQGTYTMEDFQADINTLIAFDPSQSTAQAFQSIINNYLKNANRVLRSSATNAQAAPTNQSLTQYINNQIPYNQQ
jgi:hypothetical protein